MLIGMQNVTNEIANRVRGLAVEKRFTQERIASLLGLGRTSVSARMNGAIPFTGAELAVLALAFKVSPARFFPEPSELDSTVLLAVAS